MPAFLASCMAAFDAQSPCARSFGRMTANLACGGMRSVVRVPALPSFTRLLAILKISSLSASGLIPPSLPIMQTESALRIAPRIILQFAMLPAPSHRSVIADIADRNERNHIQQCGTLRRIANHQNQRADAHHNRSNRHERETGGTILQIVSRMPLIKPLLAETQVADGNRRPPVWPSRKPQPTPNTPSKRQPRKTTTPTAIQPC